MNFDILSIRKPILSCFCFGYARYQEHFFLFEYKNVFITYYLHPSMKTCKVLGSPLGDKKNFSIAIDVFLSKFPFAHFYGISEDITLFLKKHGYYLNLFGYESHINLNSFKLSWSKTSYLKRQLSKTSHLHVKEVSYDQFLCLNLEKLNNEWLCKKKSSVFFKFLVRPLSVTNQSFVRCFIAYDGNKIVGYRLFDPIFKNQKIIGFYASVSRYDVSIKYSVSTKILLSALAVFSKEGKSTLSLGLSPFDGISLIQGNFFVSILFYLINIFSYPFSYKYLAKYKSHFTSQKCLRYVAFKEHIPYRGILETYLLMRGFYD